MASWVLTPALGALRATFNAIAPNRDRASDGSVGDAAHASSSSDHNPDETGTVPIRDADSVNEVHAIDVDETGPWPSDVRGRWTMMRAVRQLVEDHRAGRENRLRYIIYENTIWSSSWGWAAREYTGSNPHDKHAHFSGSYETAKERDTSPWNIGFQEDDMPTADEIAEAVRVKLVTDPAMQQIFLRVASLHTLAPSIVRPNGQAEQNALKTALASLDADMDAATSQVISAVEGVDEAVVERLGDSSTSVEQMVQLLRQLPGVQGREAQIAAALAP